MRGPKPTPIHLSDSERQGLEKLIKAHNTRQQIALRCRIVLASAAGKNISQVAKELRVTLDTVRLWRQRWLSFQQVPLKEFGLEERLGDLPRPGAPLQITPDQREKIKTLVCEKSEESQQPIMQRTNREIADEIVARNICKHISARHAARIIREKS